MWWHLFAARRTQRWSGETESVNKKHVADRGLGSSYLPLNWGPRCWSGRTKQWQGLFPAILIECPTDHKTSLTKAGRVAGSGGTAVNGGYVEWKDSEHWALAFRRGRTKTRNSNQGMDICVALMYKTDALPQTTCEAAQPEPRVGGGSRQDPESPTRVSLSSWWVRRLCHSGSVLATRCSFSMPHLSHTNRQTLSVGGAFRRLR